MDIIERARTLRAAINRAADSLTDEQAMECKELYKEWNGYDHFYAAGTRLLRNGELYKVLQAHTSQPGWAPEKAPALFAEILPGQEGTAIGEWVQPDSTNPYSRGDRVMFGGKVYESLIDGNVWSPAAYPAGWQEVV